MTLEDLARLGKQMRDKQREYFKHRQPSVLSESKDAERRFDAAVDDVLNPKRTLFDADACEGE